MTLHVALRRRTRKVRTDYLTPQEFADALGITRIRVYKWIERGHIVAHYAGPEDRPTYLIPRSQVSVGRKRL